VFEEGITFYAPVELKFEPLLIFKILLSVEALAYL
jgi:hypothetical protein